MSITTAFASIGSPEKVTKPTLHSSKTELVDFPVDFLSNKELAKTNSSKNVCGAISQPAGSKQVSSGDNHHNYMKKVLKTTIILVTLY